MGRKYGGNCIGVGTWAAAQRSNDYTLFFSLDGAQSSRLKSKGGWSICLYEAEYRRKCSGEEKCTLKYEDKKANCNSLEKDEASSCLEKLNKWWKIRCDIDETTTWLGPHKCHNDLQCQGDRTCEQARFCKGQDGCR